MLRLWSRVGEQAAARVVAEDAARLAAAQAERATAEAAERAAAKAAEEAAADTAAAAAKRAEEAASRAASAGKKGLVESVGGGAGTLLKRGAVPVATAYGVYQFGQLPGKLLRDVEGGGKKLWDEARHDLGQFHLPSNGDIADAAARARNSAHNIASGLLPSSTMTIGIILIGVVVAYESYRFLR